MDWILILEYFKVFASAPVMIAGMVVGFFFFFKDEISSLINRIVLLKLPGGAEVSASQEKSFALEHTGNNLPSLVDDEDAVLPLGLSNEQKDQIKQLLLAERITSYLWEYRYLNRFLVYQTQQVLDWIVALPQPITPRLFETHWLPLIPSAEERNAIISALEGHRLIVFTKDKVEVTEKGKEYQAWRGALPAPLINS